nr:dna mismatch repair protein msh1, mitochondrial [Quercus suber]
MESSWKGHVKRIHIEEELAHLQSAAEALSSAVTEDFLPIITRIRATTAPFGGIMRLVPKAKVKGLGIIEGTFF